MMKNNYRRDVDWENEKDTHVLFTGTNYKERQDKKKKKHEIHAVTKVSVQ